MGARAREALLRAKTNLSALVEALNNGKNAREWRRIYGRLAKDYEELVRALRESRVLEGFDFKRLAPANYVRNVFHVLSGILGALTYHYLIDRTGALIIMGTLVFTFTSLEIFRRYSTGMNDLLMRFPFFKHVARAHEYYRVNSATYYAWGLLIASFFAPAQAVESGCLVLAFGDPVASNLGRRFGKRKIFRDKSFVGSASFFGAAFLVLFAYTVVFFPHQPWNLALTVALVGAAAGAIAEALTVRLDDNLTVPLSVALALALVL